MQITTRNYHHAGKGRLRTKQYRISSVSCSGATLPEQIDSVSIVLYLDPLDGADTSVATRISLCFGLADSPEQIDKLIGMLTDLRAHQRLETAVEPTGGHAARRLALRHARPDVVSLSAPADEAPDDDPGFGRSGFPGDDGKDD